MQAFLRDTLHWTFWPSLLMSVALLVFGKPILALFGPPSTVIRSSSSSSSASSSALQSGRREHPPGRTAHRHHLQVVFALALRSIRPHPCGLRRAIAIRRVGRGDRAGGVIRTRLGLRSWIGFAMRDPPTGERADEIATIRSIARTMSGRRPYPPRL
jgi:hypothetical protein